MTKTCKDCGEEMGERGDNHDYCTRCIAIWYAENEIDSDVPSGDWDNDRPRYGDES